MHHAVAQNLTATSQSGGWWGRKHEGHASRLPMWGARMAPRRACSDRESHVHPIQLPWFVWLVHEAASYSERSAAAVGGAHSGTARLIWRLVAARAAACAGCVWLRIQGASRVALVASVVRLVDSGSLYYVLFGWRGYHPIFHHIPRDPEAKTGFRRRVAFPGFPPQALNRVEVDLRQRLGTLCTAGLPTHASQ